VTVGDHALDRRLLPPVLQTSKDCRDPQQTVQRPAARFAVTDAGFSVAYLWAGRPLLVLQTSFERCSVGAAPAVEL
jgi:hypothetical protein